MGYQAYTTSTPDPTSLGQPPLDPPLQEEPLERGDQGEAQEYDSPESEDNAFDIDSTTEAELQYSEDYWNAALEAQVLVPREAEEESFFRLETAPDCLKDPELEGHVALDKNERRKLVTYYQKDRASENPRVERERSVRTIAEICLVQAFADLALFKKSVLRELSVAANPYLAAAISERSDLVDLEKTRTRIEGLSAVHTEFLHYAVNTDQLLLAYFREFGDAAGQDFINTLNRELYLQLGKENLPATEDGKLLEYQGAYESLLGGISFSDILGKLDQVINLEKEAQNAPSPGAGEPDAAAQTQLQDAKASLRKDLEQAMPADKGTDEADASDDNRQQTSSPQSVIEPYEDAPDEKTE